MSSLPNYSASLDKYFCNFYKFVCRNLTKGSDPELQITDELIAIQAQYICEKYMQKKFENQVFYRDIFRAPTNNDICSRATYRTMVKFGRLLENSYPHLYSDVVEKLRYHIKYEIVICGLFTCVCDNIIDEGVTWAKIVSMYAFSGALAQDCCNSNDHKTARNISRWMGQYTHKRLATWIRCHGGWDGFVAHFKPNCLFSSGGIYLWIDRVIGLFCVFTVILICIVIVQVSMYSN